MAKIAQLGTKGAKATTGPKPFDGEMRNKLDGKSINEALEAGILTEVGNDDGEFFFEHATADAHYALFGGNYVKISDAVVGITDKATDDELGQLVFYKRKSLEKRDAQGNVDNEKGEYIETFTLGMAGGLNLGAVTKKIGAQVTAGD